jgi:hypothetical protein
LQAGKLVLLDGTGLSKDALHVHIGLAVFVASLVAGRWRSRGRWRGDWRMGNWRPLAVVVVVAMAGEIWDLVDNVRTDVPMQWAGHWKDIWNTALWPALLTLFARAAHGFRP